MLTNHVVSFEQPGPGLLFTVNSGIFLIGSDFKITDLVFALPASNRIRDIGIAFPAVAPVLLWRFVVTAPGLPQSGKNIWKMKFFLGLGKVREFCGWSGKFRKDLESQGKVRVFESKWLWQAGIRKFIYSFQEGKYSLSPSPSSLRATLK